MKAVQGPDPSWRYDSERQEGTHRSSCSRSPQRFVQVHFWLLPEDVAKLKRSAQQRDQSESAVVRRLVRALPDEGL